MNETINDLFEEQVLNTPNNIAIIEDEKKISYKELNEKVNKFTYYLKERGVKINDRICVVMNHSIDMIVTILAIIKSGATYIPIEPTFPVRRINYIVEESNAIFVITQEKYQKLFEKANRLILYNEILYKDCLKSNPENINKGSTPIYILFTSGTTGRPKGVIVEHRNVCNYAKAFIDYFKINEKDRMLQCSVCTFDIFVEELYPILLTGGTLVIANANQINNSYELLNLIKDKEVTITSTFPYFLNDIDKGIENEEQIPSTWKIAISGGDVLRKEFISKLSRRLRIFNTYGPTETTVCASYYEYDKDYKLTESIPVGKPINNVDIYIMDENLNLVDNGNIGEICISGKGVSRGYLNLEEKTRESFVSNPFKPNETLYKTGDLGRVLPDGNIDFIKRKDKQVMILGKRVEPLEVEKVMLKNDCIKNAIVKSCKDVKGYSYLTAYYTVNNGVEENINEIKKYMGDYLPEFMIPEFFVKMNSFPLTINGKINTEEFPMIRK